MFINACGDRFSVLALLALLPLRACVAFGWRPR